MPALKLIPGGIASHTSPASRPSAERILKVVRESPPITTRPMQCSCRDPGCKAQQEWLRWINDGGGLPIPAAYSRASQMCFDNVQTRIGDIGQWQDGTWHEKTSTGGWLKAWVVTVDDVDLASGESGNVRYFARVREGRLIVSPKSEPGVVDSDFQAYLEAAAHQARFEMGLDCLDVEP